MADSGNFQKQASINSDQIDRIDALNSQSDFGLFSKQSKYKSMPEFARELDRFSHEELRKILTKEQFLLAARLQAGGEFQMNPSVPLSRSEFVSYLRIPKTEIESIRVISKNETERHKNAVKDLNRNTFEQLVRTLPETKSRTELLMLFEEVWR